MQSLLPFTQDRNRNGCLCLKRSRDIRGVMAIEQCQDSFEASFPCLYWDYQKCVKFQLLVVGQITSGSLIENACDLSQSASNHYIRLGF